MRMPGDQRRRWARWWVIKKTWREENSYRTLPYLKSIWIGKDKINHNIKIKLYKALVKSILTYNCGTWALAQTELNKLDAFHRKQLRKVLNIYYPTKISNKTLYKKCNEPLSTHILESRWRLFGHILRRNEDIPANKAMQLYLLTRTLRNQTNKQTKILFDDQDHLSYLFFSCPGLSLGLCWFLLVLDRNLKVMICNQETNSSGGWDNLFVGALLVFTGVRPKS